MMPADGYSTASERNSRTQRAADEDYKSTREPKHNEAKREPRGPSPLHAESKLGREEDAQGRMLRSLPGNKKAGTSPRHQHDSPTFASLPSPSADTGKLAPLELGQCSPRSANQRLSIRSNSPDGRGLKERRRDSSEAGAHSLPSRSGSCASPRNMSPRLPAMKSPPSPRADGALPDIPSIGGAHSARRVRSLSPRRVSGAEAISPIRPDGRISCLPDADPNAYGSRRVNGPMGAEGVGRRGGGSEEKGRGTVDLLGASDDLRRCSGEGYEEKTESRHSRLSESKSCSPPRVRIDRRLSDEALPTRTGPNTQERLGPTFGSPGKRANRPSLEDIPADSRRSARKEEQQMHSTMAASPSKPALAPVGYGGGRGRDEKEGGTPNSPSGDRGDGGNVSPRTRRLRTPPDSTL